MTTIVIFGLATITMAQVPTYVPTSGLVGWWPFTGNANDGSGNGNNGTVNGATLTSDRFGNINQAYSFNGVSDFIEVPDSPTFNISNVTISSWYNAVDYSDGGVGGQRIIVSKREPSGWGNAFQMGLGLSSFNQAAANWTISGINGSFSFLDASLVPNIWFHFVYTHDNDSAKIYINGNLVQSIGIIGGLSINTLPVRFGQRPNGWHPFNGKLDDIGIWNRALTPAEITALYISNTVGINEFSKNNQISFYPNPATDVVFIESNSDIHQIKIMNVLGQVVKTLQTNSKRISVSTTDLPDNIYFIQINNSNIPMKLIKTH